jgi:hypothetical protein
VGVSYTPGQYVTYNGIVYVCLEPNVSQSDWTPTAVPALWKATTCPDGG